LNKDFQRIDETRIPEQAITYKVYVKRNVERQEEKHERMINEADTG
jgi:hypothetical protein